MEEWEEMKLEGKKGLVEPLTVKTVEVKWVTTHAAFFGKTKLSNQIMLLFLISVSKKKGTPTIFFSV